MKHLKQCLKHLRKRLEKHLKTIEHMQHPDKTLTNIRMKHLKTLETYAYNMHVYAASRSTFATSKQNICNTHLETYETFRTST